MHTVEYAPGRRADVFGDPKQPPILLWHGMQSDARAAVRPLAGVLAGHDAAVVAPDWNSHSDDGGRADLLRSVDFIRGWTQADQIVLVGWSMGGAAAAGLTLDAQRHDVSIAHTVCLAGAFMARDPISGRVVTELLSAGLTGSPFTLLHGTADDVVPVSASRDFAAALQQMGRPVEFVELAADHGSIAGAEYDPAADRYEPGSGAEARRVAADVAARIADVLPK
ncbi:alpha/beta hydrolase [Mycobacterium asiaticum]|uniref:alpha/beta hydrolase n=1 Tax=Mycobacterium asiaticum TaxID=1790 RepID=UPI0020A2FECC|nr:esterase [Mycobacterium asiaticum]